MGTAHLYLFGRWYGDGSDWSLGSEEHLNHYVGQREGVQETGELSLQKAERNQYCIKER